MSPASTPTKWLLALGIALSLFAFAAKSFAAERVQTQTKRGAFGLSPFYGMSWKSLLNSTGDAIGYQGQHFGVDLNVNLGESLGLFAEARIIQGENQDFSSEKLTGNGFSVGARVQLGEWFALSIGYGQEKSEVEPVGLNKRSLSTRDLSASLRLNLWDISDSFQLYISGTHRIGFAKPTESNPNNSGGTTTEATIGVTWSPTVSFTFVSPR